MVRFIHRLQLVDIRSVEQFIKYSFYLCNMPTVGNQISLFDSAEWASWPETTDLLVKFSKLIPRRHNSRVDGLVPFVVGGIPFLLGGARCAFYRVNDSSWGDCEGHLSILPIRNLCVLRWLWPPLSPFKCYRFSPNLAVWFWYYTGFVLLGSYFEFLIAVSRCSA